MTRLGHDNDTGFVINNLSLPLRKIITVKVHRVVDGDSLFVKKYTNNATAASRRIKVRIANIVVPELNTLAGKRSKRVLENILRTGRRVKIHVLRYVPKYRRFDAELMIGDQDVATTLLKNTASGAKLSLQHTTGLRFSTVRRLRKASTFWQDSLSG